MSAPVPALPQRPADAGDDATLADLVDRYARHVLVLAAARAGAQGVPADRLAEHALAALAIGQTITDDLRGERATIVRDALRHGAGPDQVAAAQGADTAGAPAPLDREPRSVRPPYDTADPTFEHLHATSTDAWRVAVRLDRVAALREPLEGLEVSDYEHRLIEWMAANDVPTVAVLVRLLWAARVAAPLDDPTDGGAR